MAQVLSRPGTEGKNGFLEEIQKLAGEDFQRCYQCGTCSVVCPTTPNDHAFPRKEMLWAQWGMADALLRDPDVWLCHQCNDCNTHCPMNARPGDLMAAVRAYQITHFASPAFLARPATDPKALPLAFILPVLVTLGLLFFAVLVPRGGLAFPEGPVMFAHFIPSEFIDVSALSINALSFIAAGIGLARFWHNVRSFEVDQSARGSLPGAFIAALRDIGSHRRFQDCGTNQPRFRAHLAVFYGFLCLFAATTGAFVYTAFLKRELSLPLYDPVKLIGNLGFILMLGGLAVVTLRRFAPGAPAGRSNYFDWFFIALLYLVILTGFGLQALRLLETGPVAYLFYLVHLVFVFALFIYLPYSKFAHILYRTAAMTWVKYVGRT